MSTKNIALDSRVYQKLARLKRESESFSKAIDRIITQAAKANTGREILTRLSEISPLGDEDGDKMQELIERARIEEEWPEHDLG